MKPFCPTLALCAADFKQKSRWSAVWPNMHYGAMYLNYSVGRQLPMKSVNWVTRDCNRLINFSDRYASVIRDIDVKRNKEELKIPLSDIRWNDHRRIFWRCSFCGSSYRKNVSVRVKYHAGCNFCKGKHASEVLQQQVQSIPLKDYSPELAKELTEAEELTDNASVDASTEKTEPEQSPSVLDNIAKLSSSSKYRATWKCRCCGNNFQASIRSRTGVVERSQAQLYENITEWTAYCPSCRWEKNLSHLGQRILEDGQFLGLQIHDDD